MLSVVIPTMWQFEPFCDFIEDVVQLPIVDEIIIINNLVEKTPNHSVLSNAKIKMHNTEKNIYTNPSWNLGVKLAQNKKVCVMNDDVIVDLKIFKRVHDHMTAEQGITAITIPREIYDLHYPDHDNIKDLNKLIVTGQLKIKKCFDQESNLGWGGLFFIHKDNWIDIHPDLLIMYGDTWVFDTQLRMGRMNYLVVDCFFYSPWNTTWSKSNVVENVGEILNRETYDLYIERENEVIAKLKAM